MSPETFPNGFWLQFQAILLGKEFDPIFFSWISFLTHRHKIDFFLKQSLHLQFFFHKKNHVFTQYDHTHLFHEA